MTRFHCGLLECSETRHTVQKIRHQAEDESPQLLLRQDMASLADVGVKVLQLIYFIESVSQFIDEIFFSITTWTLKRLNSLTHPVSSDVNVKQHFMAQKTHNKQQIRGFYLFSEK